MPAKKKATVKKTVAKKKVTTKTKAAPIKKKKAVAVKEPMTKTQLLSELSESTELSKKEVQSVLDELANIIDRHVTKRGAGQFTLPGMLKVKVVRKPATKARKGINPFTGEETVFKAKPARNVVKILPLKKMKDMVA